MLVNDFETSQELVAPQLNNISRITKRIISKCRHRDRIANYEQGNHPSRREDSKPRRHSCKSGSLINTQQEFYSHQKERDSLGQEEDRRCDNLEVAARKVCKSALQLRTLTAQNAEHCLLQNQLFEFDIKNLSSCLDWIDGGRCNISIQNEQLSKTETNWRDRSRNKSLPGEGASKMIKRKPPKVENRTFEDAPVNDINNTHNEAITKLVQDNRKLEKKCDSRKLSLKKLYFIVVEKDRQLRQVCAAVENAGDSVDNLKLKLERQSLGFSAKIHSLENTLKRAAHKLALLSSHISSKTKSKEKSKEYEAQNRMLKSIKSKILELSRSIGLRNNLTSEDALKEILHEQESFKKQIKTLLEKKLDSEEQLQVIELSNRKRRREFKNQSSNMLTHLLSVENKFIQEITGLRSRIHEKDRNISELQRQLEKVPLNWEDQISELNEQIEERILEFEEESKSHILTKKRYEDEIKAIKEKYLKEEERLSKQVSTLQAKLKSQSELHEYLELEIETARDRSRELEASRDSFELKLRLNEQSSMSEINQLRDTINKIKNDYKSNGQEANIIAAENSRLNFEVSTQRNEIEMLKEKCSILKSNEETLTNKLNQSEAENAKIAELQKEIKKLELINSKYETQIKGLDEERELQLLYFKKDIDEKECTINKLQGDHQNHLKTQDAKFKEVQDLLNTELDNLRSSFQSKEIEYNEEIERLRNDIESLEHLNNGLSEEIENALNRAIISKNLLSDSQEENSRLTTQISTLLDKKTADNTSCQILSSQLDEIQKDNTILREETINLKEELSNLKRLSHEQSIAQHTEITKMKESLKTKCSELELLEMEKNQYTSEIKDLSKQIEFQQSIIDSQGKEIEEKNVQIDGLKEKVDEFLSVKQVLENDVEVLREFESKCHELENQLITSNKLIETKEKQIFEGMDHKEIYAAEIDRLKQQLLEKDDKIRVLSLQKQDIEKQLQLNKNESEQTLKATREERQILEDKLKNSNESNSQLKIDIEKLVDNLSTLERNYQAEIKDLQSEKTELESNISHLHNEALILQNSVIKLGGDVALAKEIYDKAENEHNQRAISMKQELNSKQLYINSLKEEYEASQLEISSIKFKLESRNAEVASIKKELEATQLEICSIKETLEAKHIEISSMNQILKERDEEITSMNQRLEEEFFLLTNQSETNISDLQFQLRALEEENNKLIQDHIIEKENQKNASLIHIEEVTTALEQINNNKLNDLQAKIDQILETKTAEIELLTNHIQEHKHTIHELNIKVEDLTKESSSQGQEIDDLKEINTGLNSQIEALEERERQMMINHDKLAKVNLELSTKINGMEDKQDQEILNLVESQKQLNDNIILLREQETDLRDALAKAREHEEVLNDRVLRSDKIVAQKEEKIETLKKDIEAKDEEIHNISLKIENLMQNEESLISKLNHLEERLGIEVENNKNHVLTETNLNQDIEEHKLRIDHLSGEKNKLEISLSTQQKSITILKSKFTSTQSSIKLLNSHVSSCLKELASSLILVNSEFQLELKSAEKELSKKLEDLATQVCKEKELRIECERAAEEIARLEKCLDNEGQQNHQELERLVKENHNLQDRNSSLITQLKKVEKEGVAITANKAREVERLQLHISELSSQIEDLEKESQSKRIILENKIDELQLENSSLSTQVQDLEHRNRVNTDEQVKLIDELTLQISSLNVKNEEIALNNQIEIDKLTKEKAELTNKIESLNLQIRNIEQDSQSMQDCLSKKINELNIQISSLDLEHKTLEASSLAMSDELNDLNQQIAHLTQKYNYLEKESQLEKSKLVREVEELSHQVGFLKINSEKSSQEIENSHSELKQTCNDLKLQITTLQSEKEQQIKIRIELENNQNLLENEIASLRTQNENLIKEEQKRCTEINELKDQISTLLSKIEKLEIDLNARICAERDKETNSLVLQINELSLQNQKFEQERKREDHSITQCTVPSTNQDIRILSLKNIALRFERVSLLRKEFILNSKMYFKDRMLEKLENSITRLEDQLMHQTEKVLDMENKRSDLEDQLAIRENQLEEIYTQSIRSGTENDISSRNNTHASAMTGDGQIRSTVGPLKNLVYTLTNFFDLDVPSLEKMNDAKWEVFIRTLKIRLNDEQQERERLTESISNYKRMLNQMSKEAEQMENKLKGIYTT